MYCEQDRVWLEEAIQKVKEKMEWVSEKSRYKIPYTTVNGTHDDRSGADESFSPDYGIYWWSNGFWGGMLHAANLLAGRFNPVGKFIRA